MENNVEEVFKAAFTHVLDTPARVAPGEYVWDKGS